MKKLQLLELGSEYLSPSQNDKQIVFQQSETWETELVVGGVREDRVRVVAFHDTDLRIAVFMVWRGERLVGHSEFITCAEVAYVATVTGASGQAAVQRAAIELFDHAHVVQEQRGWQPAKTTGP